jgi:NarL family two-component system response regulator LiaR
VTDERAECGTATTIRVLVVDDHPVVRNGIAISLLACADIEVVGQAKSGEDAIRYCAEVEPEQFPDVVLMDLIMPGMGGVAAIRALRTQYPTMRIVALTSFQECTYVEETLQAGAIGYLIKDAIVEQLAEAIRQANRGMLTLAPAATRWLVRRPMRRPPPLGHDLTDRERDVLALLVKGLSNKEIAKRLVVTLATVKFHTRGIRHKLGTSNRTETVVYALTNHLVPGPSM